MSDDQLVPDSVVEMARRRFDALDPAEQERRRAYWHEVDATVEPEAMFDWEQQAAQYPASGPPGISYVARTHPAGVPINCLLHRDERGELDAVLNQYPQGVPGLQAPHTDNLWVRPDRRGRGLGTALIVARQAQGWPHDLEATRLTPAGRAALRRARRIWDPADPRAGGGSAPS